MGSEKAYKGEDITSTVNDVRNTLAGMARQDIYNVVPSNVKQAYIDYGNLHAINALADKATSGGVVKAGGTGTTLKNIFQMGAIPVGTVGGQTIYTVGQGIEFLGPQGAKTVAALLGMGGPSQAGTTSQPPQQPTQPPVQPQAQPPTQQ